MKRGDEKEREGERGRDRSLLSLSLSRINTASHREDVSFRRFASRLNARVIADARHSVIAICSTVLLSREVRFIAREFRSERKSKGNVFPCFVGARERERKIVCTCSNGIVAPCPDLDFSRRNERQRCDAAYLSFDII